MLRYVIRRILHLIPVLFGISLITFTLSFIVPGDPVRAIMGQRSDREAELRIRQKFGLDKPWYVQYYLWVRNLVRNPGELPTFKLRVQTDEGTEVYHFQLTGDTLLATDGQLRPVINEPFQRKVLTHLYERDCPAPDIESIGSTGGGTTRTLLELDTSASLPRALLEDFQGEKTWFDIDTEIEACSDGRNGGIELVSPGDSYTAWFRSEGFQTGRDFTAIFTMETETVIDGMWNEASVDHAEVRALSDPVRMTINSRHRSGSSYIFELEDESGGITEIEIMPNAVLMLGGNRSNVEEFDPGMTVNVAFTSSTETELYAVHDEESAGLAGIDELSLPPDVITATGRISDMVLSPAIWFDFGRSYRQQREVRDIIRGSFKNTAYLSVLAMIIAILVGVSAGIISAVKPYSAVDYFTMTLALIGVSMPVFWLGLMLILLFQGQLGWITGIGFGEITWHEINLGLLSFHMPWHQNVILPSVTLATVPMAIIARMTRSSMLEVMNLDYIRTARAKGLGEWAVIIRHALKNSLIPIITVIGLNFALLLAGAVLTETVFSWPGLGREIVDAIEFRDFPVVMAGVVLFAFVFVMVNLVVDILYAYVDPRIRYQ